MKFGYRFGLKQTLIKLPLSLQIPEEFSSEVVDTWMLQALEADVNNYELLLLGQPQGDACGLSYLRRLMLVTSVLLQDIRAPIFERIAVETLEQNTDKNNTFSAQIWFPLIDGFSRAALQHWLVVAHKLLISVCQTGGDFTQLEAVVDALHQEHCKPWLAKMPGAKSLIPILQAAFELGVPVESCGSGRYVLGWGSQARIFDRSSNSFDSVVGAQLSHRKDQAIRLMRQAGIPVPQGVVVHRQKPILPTLRPPSPWVVKPVDKDRGEGVTLGLHDESSLQEALRVALKMSVAALIEEQVLGVCHRILVVEGKVMFVVKRNPRSVSGDGKHSIRQLVERHNAALRRKIPIKRLPEFVLDELAMRCLAECGLSEDSVPAAGQSVSLRPVQSTQWGGDPEVVTEHLHPANAQIALRAARLFGLSCVGVDFISTDISKPWYENAAVINEVNYAPVIGRTHAYQRDGTKAYLTAVFPEQGRIPIQVYLGAQTALTAHQQYQALVHAGVHAFFCDDYRVLTHESEEIRLAHASNSFERIQTLRFNRDIQHLIVHIDNDESFAKVGLPFEYVTSAQVSSIDQLSQSQSQIFSLLSDFCIPSQLAQHDT